MLNTTVSSAVPAIRKTFTLGLLFVAFAALGSTSLNAQNIFLVAANPSSASPAANMSITASGFTAGVAAGTVTVTLTPQFVAPTLTAPGTIPGTGTSRSINYVLPAGAAGFYSATVAGSGVTSSNSVTVQILAAPSFTLNPVNGLQGATLPVTITGANTTFPSGATTASFGPGISVGGAAEGAAGPVVNQPNGTVIANLVINPEATTGTRTVTVQGLDVITQAGVFSVLQRVRTLTLTGVAPASGAAGSSPSISASGFEANVTAPSMTVTLTPQAGGAPIIVAGTTPGLTGARSVSFTVPVGTVPGAYNVTVSGTNYVSGNAVVFTVTPPPSFTLNPVSGARGATVQVTISGANTTFPGGTTANFGPGISVGGAAQNTAGPVAIQPNGTAIATLTILASATLGARTVTVTGASAIVQSNAFTVTPSLTLVSVNPSSAAVNSAVSITATGFVINDTPTLSVTLTPNGGGAPVIAATTIQGSSANRTVNFTVPAGTPPGAYSVTLAGSSYTSGNSLPFNVTSPPSFSLSPTSGLRGTTLQVTITGANTTFPSGATTANFGPGISVGGAAEGAFGPVTVQPNGTAIANLTINPAASAGARTVQVNGLDVISQINAFTVNQTTLTLISINPNSAAPNAAISITTTGFVVNDTPTLAVTLAPNAGGSPVTAAATIQGSAANRTVNFTVPAGTPVGAYTITLAGSGYASGNSLPFTVTPPPSFTLNPASGGRGTTIQVVISGANTTFPGGATTASFGPGISVGGAAEGAFGPVAVQPNGTAIASLTINSGAVAGSRTVQVTGLDAISQPNAFTVTQNTLTLISVNPGSAAPNSAISVTATGFVANEAPVLTATLTPNAGGSPILVATAIQGTTTNRTVNFTLPPGTPVGAYTLTLAGSGYVSGNSLPFTVTPPPSFTLNPASGAPGATIQVTITGANTTLPAGASTANFGPGISVGGAAEGAFGPIAVQPNGTAVATVTISAGAGLGGRTVQVNGLDAITQANAFTVAQNTLTLITINPASAAPNSAISITASGFGVNDTPVLTVTLSANAGGVPVTAATTIQGTGSNRTVNFTLPAGTPTGGYTVTLAGSNYGSANSLPFTVTQEPAFTLNPVSASPGSTVQVTITGTNTTFPVGATTANFGPGIAVGGAAEGAFGPVAVLPNGSAIATLVINAAAILGTRTVQVTGLDALSRPNAFTVAQNLLTLITITPGSAAPGAAIAITASGFVGNDSPVLTVTLSPNAGGSQVIAATSIQGSGASRTINFILPAGTPTGAYSVTLGGSGYASANALPFTVSASPSFTLSPISGNTGSTVQVTITGANTTFPAGGTTANFGAGISVGGAAEGNFGPVAVQPNGTAIATLTINSIAPVGLRTVQVNGQDAITQANAFSVTAAPPPQITSVTPSNAQQGQTLSLTITGTNTRFTNFSTVSLGADIAVNTVTRNSDTSLTVNITIAGNATVGARDVVVTTDGIPLTGAGLFTVAVAPPIQLISVSPSTGVQGNTLTVTITGSGTHFSTGSTVTFGAGVAVNSVSFGTATSLTANLSIDPNASIGPRTVTVTSGSEVATGTGLFSVQALAPELSSINPNTGVQGQTLNVTINGSNFRSGATASFGVGVTVNSVTFNSSSSLTASITIDPGASPGARDLTVTSNGVPVSLLNAFTVTAGTPRILSVTPTSILQGQTRTLTITGEFTSFQQGVTQVSLGQGVTIGTITVTSPTTLTVVVTAAANATAGSRTLTVTTGPQVVTTQITIDPVSGPSLLSVTPGSGQQGANLDVAVVGILTNFAQGASQVSFGPGININSVTVSSATSLSANISISPQASPGVRTVTVATGQQSVSLADSFAVVSSNRDQTLTCASNAGVPPLLRAEGFTELAGDILVVCTGGTAGQTSSVNVQLFLNVPITSRLVGGESEALLLVDELGTGGSGPLSTPASYRAVAAQGDNSIVWANVAFTAPGPGNQRTLRITNVRANVTSLAASAAIVPSQVFAFLSVSPSQSLPLGQAQHTIGFVLPGLAFDVTNCSGSAAVSNAFAQCMAENSSGNRDLIGGTTGNIQFGVRFTEGFQTAFKTQLVPNQNPSTPGLVYNSESGFVGARGAPFTVGGADAGTRLIARFNNIPEGVRLFVTTRPSFGSTVGLDAVLVQTGPNGAGSAGQPGSPVGIASTATLLCPLNTSTGIPAAEISITNNSAVAVWEVTGANAAVLESAVFGVAVAYASDTPNQRPGLGQASVSGNFGPFYPATSSAARMSSTLPIPRFLDAPRSANAFRIDPCVTNLLFPFVTNQAGFDTGIAISNTSSDPFGLPQRQQSGACTVNYYGELPGGPAPAPQRTTSRVASGSQLAFVLSSGGSHGLPATPGFQGYLIVQCDFRCAHGFAFVTDGPIGTARVAEGYLALVMDAPVPTRGTVSETLSH